MKPERSGDSQRLLLVNYHYIRDRTQYEHPGIYPIELEEFDAQVRCLRKRFHIATPQEVTGFLRAEHELPGPSIFLTFDDGLVEHPSVARNILDSYDIKAAFFVCSRPYIEKKPLTVHKIHWLRATTPPDSFVREFLDLLPDELHRTIESEETKRQAKEMYIYDDIETGVLKYFMNFIVEPRLMDSITDTMLKRRNVTQEEFCEKTYMTKQEMLNLVRNSHVIGSHGHSHIPLSQMGCGDILENDLQRNIAFIKHVTGTIPTWFSYPYGREWAIPSNESVLIGKHNLEFAFSLLPGWNHFGENNYKVRRINPNDLAKYC